MKRKTKLFLTVLMSVLLVFTNALSGCSFFNITSSVSKITITGKPSGGLFLFGESNNTFLLGIKSEPAGNVHDFTVVWNSTDMDVAQIDETGKVTVKKLGETEIRAEVKDNESIKDSFDLSVISFDTPEPTEPEEPTEPTEPEEPTEPTEPEEPTDPTEPTDPVKAVHAEITNKPKYSRLAKNAMHTLGYVFLPSNASEPEAVWSSSDNAVATVSSSGGLAALKVGRTVISLVIDGTGCADSFELIVYGTEGRAEDFETMTLSNYYSGTGKVELTMFKPASTKTKLYISSSDLDRPDGGSGKYLKSEGINDGWNGPRFKIENIEKNKTYRIIFDLKLIQGYDILNLSVFYMDAAGNDITGDGINVYRSIALMHGESMRVTFDFTPNVNLSTAEITVYPDKNSSSTTFTIDNLLVDELENYSSASYESFEQGLNFGAVKISGSVSGGFKDISITKEASEIPFNGCAAAAKIIFMNASGSKINIGTGNLTGGSYSVSFKVKFISGSGGFTLNGQSVSENALSDGTGTVLCRADVSNSNAGEFTLLMTGTGPKLNCIFILDDIKIVKRV